MREVERNAASVDEAVEAALAELGADRGDVDVEVLDEGRSGFLGVGSAEARVRVTLRMEADTTDDGDGFSGGRSDVDEPSTQGSDDQGVAQVGSAAPAGESKGEPDAGETSEASEVASEVDSRAGGGSETEDDGDEWLDDQADLVADYLEDLFDVMDLRAEVEPLYEDGTMYVDVWASDDEESLALLIGRHGSALDALQEIVRGVVHHRTGERCQVVVDVEDYRKRRRAQLVARARQAARRVQETGRSERLDPMNAFERKIVHDAVSDVSGVSTGSEGEEPERRVVISRS